MHCNRNIKLTPVVVVFVAVMTNCHETRGSSTWLRFIFFLFGEKVRSPKSAAAHGRRAVNYEEAERSKAKRWKNYPSRPTPEPLDTCKSSEKSTRTLKNREVEVVWNQKVPGRSCWPSARYRPLHGTKQKFLQERTHGAAQPNLLG